MIMSINLKPFDKFCELPAYVYGNGVDRYVLTATIIGGYEITLARLIVGNPPTIKVNDMTHALFESYTPYGKKMIETKARATGFKHGFVAAINAMEKAGISFNSVAPCHFSDLLNALGAHYNRINPDIQDCFVVTNVSLTRHI